MLSAKQRTELLDALADFNSAMKKHADELQDWERNVLALNMAICTCMLQQKVLKRDAAAIMQKALDQIVHYSKAKEAQPLLGPAQLARMIAQEKAVLEKKLSILEGMVDQGEEADIRSLYNEIVAATEPGDDNTYERLCKVRHIMGWVQ